MLSSVFYQPHRLVFKEVRQRKTETKTETERERGRERGREENGGSVESGK